MTMKSKMRLTVYLVLGILWLCQDHSMGARIAGEQGISPVSPVAETETGRSPKRPLLKTAPERKPKEVEVQKTTKTQEERGEDPRYVTIDFDSVDIEIFIKFISELTGKNFVVDKAVRGKVTIISPTKISVDEAYKVFESVLEVHGFAAVPAGNITKIISVAEARTKDIETRVGVSPPDPEDKIITQLIPLRYASPDELKRLFTPLISKNSVIVSYPPTGMLIITDVLSNVKRLLKIIKVLDVEGTGEEVSVISLEHATAAVLAKSMTTLFQRRATKVKAGASRDSLIKIVPVERTNVLIVLASEDDTMRIRQLIHLLDREAPRGAGDINVYYLQNANAEDLSKVLTALPSKEKTGTEKGKAPVLSKDVQIVADKATNSLVITANKEDYLVLEDVIKKLDIPRRMVYIEALIMEVSVNKGFDLGVEWHGVEGIGSHDGREAVGFGGTVLGESISPSIDVTSGIVNLPLGLSLGILGEGITIGGITFPSIGAVIRAYQTDSDVHILSTPQVMTTDNEEAEIYVGKNIPFLTRQDTSETGIDYSNYEFKDVGVTLNITPQISLERFVRLKISHELAQVVEQEVVGLPTTLKRVAKTTVVVRDGHTVVIGGLIDETLSENTSQVPCMGNIPGLGWLFKSVSRSADKTNLFIFLTPHIIEDQSEAKKIYQKKKEYIDKVEEGVIKMYKRKADQPTESEGE
ncbi:MAG: type II secretion system secretin GspD [Thermodesulfobacteriota bacterium]|nr:type II secretion system secretin GspD [Thermodesulfobacteriota bacterium]